MNTCFNRNLSDGEQLRFNRAFDDSPDNTWLRKEALIKIGQAKKKRERGPASLDRGPHKAHDRGHPTTLYQIERNANFAVIFL